MTPISNYIWHLSSGGNISKYIFLTILLIIFLTIIVWEVKGNKNKGPIQAINELLGVINESPLVMLLTAFLAIIHLIWHIEDNLTAIVLRTKSLGSINNLIQATNMYFLLLTGILTLGLLILLLLFFKLFYKDGK